MSEAAPFAFAPDGGVFAAGDGPELLVWKADGAPLWKVFTDGLLVALAMTVEEVITLDADGRVGRYRRADGEYIDGFELGDRPFDLRAAPTGLLGVATARGVVFVDASGQRREIAHPGLTAFAFGPDGASVGLGTGSGTFTAVELASGAAWGAVALPGPIGAVGWSALGTWVVGAGASLHRVKGDGGAVTRSLPPADAPITAVAVSSNGLVAAAVAGDHVELYELAGDKPLGAFVLRRVIGGVAFGNGHRLGIGLDDGDASVVDVATTDSVRTEPHPGRGRNTWRVESKVDLMAVRGALATMMAGGQPIARYVPPPQSAEPESRTMGCLGGCAGVVGVVLVLAVFCAGIGLVVYFARMYGVWVPGR
ncbi:MAG: hypothetical protein ABMA64_18365 [Myxococcota bacterium]